MFVDLSAQSNVAVGQKCLCCANGARCQGGEVLGPTEWTVTPAATAAVMNRITASNVMQVEGRDTAKNQRCSDHDEQSVSAGVP